MAEYHFRRALRINPQSRYIHCTSFVAALHVAGNLVVGVFSSPANLAAGLLAGRLLFLALQCPKRVPYAFRLFFSSLLTNAPFVKEIHLRSSIRSQARTLITTRGLGLEQRVLAERQIDLFTL